MQIRAALGLVFTFVAAAGSAEAQIKFKDVSAEAGVIDKAVNATGPAFADYDQDGDVDIFVSTEAIGEGIALRLWENDGKGHFRDVAKERGLDTPNVLGRGSAWGDFDNDGDLDLAIATMPPSGGTRGPYTPSSIFKNLLKETGQARFENVTRAAKFMRKDNEADMKAGGVGNTGGGIGFVDYDNDGWLDILHRNADAEIDNALFHSNRDGTFTDVTEESGLTMHGRVKESNSQGAPTWADFDNDGDQDALITNEGDFSVLFINEGNGKFTDVMNARQPPSGLAFRLAGNAQGACIGDVDNDGDIDVYTPLADQANRLYRNDLNLGKGLTFTDITQDSGAGDMGGARGCVMADFDNDGLLDIYVNNGGLQNVLINDKIAGFPPFVRFFIAWERAYGVLYRGLGGGKFQNVTKGSGAEILAIGSGVGAGDVNGDGFLDMFVASRTYYSQFERKSDPPGQTWLLMNRGNKNGWVRVALKGTRSNASGLGARIRVVSGDLSQIRERVSAHGYNSASEPTETFGLGKRTGVDYIEVRWPSGQVQRVDRPNIRTTVVIEEPR